MTKQVSVIVLIVALSWCAPSSRGQTATSSPPSLSLKDAEALALKNHPQLQAAQLTALAAKQVVTEAGPPTSPLLMAA